MMFVKKYYPCGKFENMGYKIEIDAREFRFGPTGIWENDTIRGGDGG